VKYGGRGAGSVVLAERLIEAFAGRWSGLIPDDARPAIVPVPLRPWKYFRRGYNVPALIGSALACRTGWTFAPALLRRDRERRPQAGLPLPARTKNVEDAFYVPREARLPPLLLLLDDVYTSGATAASCARALRKAGADRIVVATIARAVV